MVFSVKLENCLNEISGETILLHNIAGIPLIYPGELITKEILNQLINNYYFNLNTIKIVNKD